MDAWNCCAEHFSYLFQCVAVTTEAAYCSASHSCDLFDGIFEFFHVVIGLDELGFGVKAAEPLEWFDKAVAKVCGFGLHRDCQDVSFEVKSYWLDGNV